LSHRAISLIFTDFSHIVLITLRGISSFATVFWLLFGIGRRKCLLRIEGSWISGLILFGKLSFQIEGAGFVVLFQGADRIGSCRDFLSFQILPLIIRSFDITTKSPRVFPPNLFLFPSQTLLELSPESFPKSVPLHPQSPSKPREVDR